MMIRMMQSLIFKLILTSAVFCAVCNPGLVKGAARGGEGDGEGEGGKVRESGVALQCMAPLQPCTADCTPWY